VSGEVAEPGLRPNVRPESCPRISGEVVVKSDQGIGLYLAGFSVLTVGDGNLSFSLALARALGGECVTATTWESRSEVLAIYKAPHIVHELENDLGATVMDRVDAARLGERFSDCTFDYIVFNFPCVAPADAAPGEDGQMQHFEHNRALLSGFGSCAAALLNDGGQVHVSHKTKASFGQWGLCELIQGDSGLICLGAVVFDRAAYVDYRPAKQRDAKSFPVSDACTFAFGFPDDEDDFAAHEWLAKQTVLVELTKAAKKTGRRTTRVTRGMVDLIKRDVLSVKS